MLNETPLSSKQRNNLDDKQLGIPEIRAYPLNDKSHVIQAVRMFNYVDSKYEKELADNLIKAIKKFKIDVTVGKDNRFHKYYIKESRDMRKTVGAILEGLNGSRERFSFKEALDNYLEANLKGFNRGYDSYEGHYWTVSVDFNHIIISDTYKKQATSTLKTVYDLGSYGKTKDTFKKYKKECERQLRDAEQELDYIIKVLGEAKIHLKKEGYPCDTLNIN